MKKSFWFSASLLVLIWTIYYYAKRTTGGLTNTLDNSVCILIIFFNVVRYIKNKK